MIEFQVTGQIRVEAEDRQEAKEKIANMGGDQLRSNLNFELVSE